MSRVGAKTEFSSRAKPDTGRRQFPENPLTWHLSNGRGHGDRDEIRSILSTTCIFTARVVCVQASQDVLSDL